jgi:hypothetical protein
LAGGRTIGGGLQAIEASFLCIEGTVAAPLTLIANKLPWAFASTLVDAKRHCFSTN